MAINLDKNLEAVYLRESKGGSLDVQKGNLVRKTGFGRVVVWMKEFFGQKKKLQNILKETKKKFYRTTQENLAQNKSYSFGEKVVDQKKLGELFTQCLIRNKAIELGDTIFSRSPSTPSQQQQPQAPQPKQPPHTPQPQTQQPSQPQAPQPQQQQPSQPQTPQPQTQQPSQPQAPQPQQTTPSSHVQPIPSKQYPRYTISYPILGKGYVNEGAATSLTQQLQKHFKKLSSNKNNPENVLIFMHGDAGDRMLSGRSGLAKALIDKHQGKVRCVYVFLQKKRWNDSAHLDEKVCGRKIETIFVDLEENWEKDIEKVIERVIERVETAIKRAQNNDDGFYNYTEDPDWKKEQEENNQ